MRPSKGALQTTAALRLFASAYALTAQGFGVFCTLTSPQEPRHEKSVKATLIGKHGGHGADMAMWIGNDARWQFVRGRRQSCIFRLPRKKCLCLRLALMRFK
jgi:hypothetical protein